jgi:superfamily II DNA or RNA helicase
MPGQQIDLFPDQSPEAEIQLPEQLALDYKLTGNPVRQLLKRKRTVTATFRTQQIGRRKLPVATVGDEEILITTKPLSSDVPDGMMVLRILGSTTSDLQQIITELRSSQAKTKWLKPAAIVAADEPSQALQRTNDVITSWQDAFRYHEENIQTGSSGLRIPQMGALHAVLAHWSVAPEDPASVVMPTGTGKTDTMLALLINRQINHLLVVVPTNALRDQIARKFETLDVLQASGVVSDSIQHPIVGRIQHRFETTDEVEQFINSCNVVVTTMAAVNACSDEVRQKIAELCPNLVIDEAHHVSAPSWDAFRQQFSGKPILQFTATPFRNDGKYVGGKIIYAYPLGKAQEDGYFTKINFSPVYEYTEHDKAIAEQALAHLDEDITADLDHIIMARVSSIERAEEVFALYNDIAPNHSPLLIHSKRTEAQKREALEQLNNRTSRVVVCVDMLGEGFDLPELKIAALHDIHKSLAITLQFTGRFTRVRRGGNIGEAKVVVNIADAKVNKQIKDLYAEDADWNKLIKDYSQSATSAEQRRSDFLNSFVKLPEEISVQNIEPRMSTVVYKSQATDWEPDSIAELFPEEVLYTKEIAINRQHKVAWFVTEQHERIKWANLKGIDNVTYDLYVVYWDVENKLLFINSSNNSSVHEELAKAVAGDEAAIIRGAEMYRSMHRIERMVPINLGLTDITSRTTRFTMFAGSDVGAGLDQSQTRNKTKTNMFGFGYENGEKVSIGCSQKGRVWSYLVANDIGEWVKWCKHVGKKLIDDTIDLSEIYGNLVRPQPLTERPPFVPLAVEWHLQYMMDAERISLKVDGQSIPFHDVSLEVSTFTNTGPLKFNVVTPDNSYEYEVLFNDERTAYRAVGTDIVMVRGQTEKPLSDWLNARPVRIIFEGDRIVEDDFMFEYNSDVPPFDAEQIDTWDWNGVDLRKESQQLTKRADSIQRRVIERLMADEQDWDIIFDDDGSGEAADVVAIKVAEDRLIIRLYHCKFSSGDTAGARIDDMYAVCGQAQKSVFWREHPEKLIPHLIERARKRDQNNQTSRFEKGDFRDLSRIGWREEQMQKDFRAIIVQPGLSKAQATVPILNVLGATSLYLQTTFNIGLDVIASD